MDRYDCFGELPEYVHVDSVFPDDDGTGGGGVTEDDEEGDNYEVPEDIGQNIMVRNYLLLDHNEVIVHLL